MMERKREKITLSFSFRNLLHFHLYASFERNRMHLIVEITVATHYTPCQKKVITHDAEKTNRTYAPGTPVTKRQEKNAARKENKHCFK